MVSDFEENRVRCVLLFNTKGEFYKARCYDWDIALPGAQARKGVEMQASTTQVDRNTRHWTHKLNDALPNKRKGLHISVEAFELSSCRQGSIWSAHSQSARKIRLPSLECPQSRDLLDCQVFPLVRGLHVQLDRRRKVVVCLLAK